MFYERFSTVISRARFRFPETDQPISVNMNKIKIAERFLRPRLHPLSGNLNLALEITVENLS